MELLIDSRECTESCLFSSVACMCYHIDREIIIFAKRSPKVLFICMLQVLFARKNVNNLLMTPATFLHLGETIASANAHRTSLPSHSSVPGFHPSKWLWRIEASLCKGRCSVGNPKELADISPLWADAHHLGFADQVSMGWNVHGWG